MVKLKTALFVFFISCLLLVLISFRYESNQAEGEIFVEGQVFYNFSDPLYANLKVQGKIYEDGKLYKKFSCKDKGKFNTSVGINHNYVFHFSMDYHATTKVLVSTILPPEKTKEKVGGLFKFKCEIFERVEGLSLNLLKRPIIKIRYVAEKDKFEPDKAYTERFLWELESFKETLATLKQKSRKVHRTPQKATASKKPKKEVKEEDLKDMYVEQTKKKKKKSSNPRQHRNIMDNLTDDNSQEKDQLDEVVDTSVQTSPDELAISKNQVEPEEEEPETEEQNEPIIEGIPEIWVYPKREKIVSESTVNIASKKIKIREISISTRNNYEEDIKQETMARKLEKEEEDQKRLTNKYIQSLRLQEIIKTVAVTEQSDGAYQYSKKPILEFEVLPLIKKEYENGWFVDTEIIKIIYPTKRITYYKKEYIGLFDYYYRNHDEVDYNTFCQEIKQYDKNINICQTP